MQGRQLRLRVLKLEPGGVIGLHSHKNRPAVAYPLQGTLTEHREGGRPKDTAGNDITHWEENKGKTPVVLVAADIFKP